METTTPLPSTPPALRRGPKPRPRDQLMKSVTITVHPEFLRLLDLQPGANRPMKIEQAFGFDRRQPEKGLQR